MKTDLTSVERSRARGRSRRVPLCILWVLMSAPTASAHGVEDTGESCVSPSGFAAAGPTTVALGHGLVLNVPEGHYFFDTQQAWRMPGRNGGPRDARVLGIVARQDERASWKIVLQEEHADCVSREPDASRGSGAGSEGTGDDFVKGAEDLVAMVLGSSAVPVFALLLTVASAVLRFLRRPSTKGHDPDRWKIS